MAGIQQLLLNTFTSIRAIGGNVSVASSIQTVFHVFTSPGSLELQVVGTGSSGYYIDPSSFKMVAFGAGGGPAGNDWSLSGGAGGGGGASYGTLSLGSNYSKSFDIYVGGGGGNSANNPGPGQAGVGGTNGGAPGQTRLAGGSSGGGGGGWSGVGIGTTFFIVAGGGSGGPGIYDTPFNFDSPAGPGGSGGGPGAGTPGPMTGTGGGITGTPTSAGAGGGGGGMAGGGYNVGGQNYINPILSNRLSYGGAAAQGAPGFLPANPEYSPVIPALIGDASQPGIVVISYKYVQQ